MAKFEIVGGTSVSGSSAPVGMNGVSSLSVGSETFAAADGAMKALSDREGEYFLFPGFCDVHVHLREPGFSY
ncbi:MAG: hypothetical protein ACSW8J_01310, partial [bacterium]